MSREQFEAEMYNFIDDQLREAEKKIKDKYPGAFDSFATINSPIGVSEKYHYTKREEYIGALMAGVRWSVWLNMDFDKEVDANKNIS